MREALHYLYTLGRHEVPHLVLFIKEGVCVGERAESFLLHQSDCEASGRPRCVMRGCRVRAYHSAAPLPLAASSQGWVYKRGGGPPPRSVSQATSGVMNEH